jgi:hypothetical protein
MVNASNIMVESRGFDDSQTTILAAPNIVTRCFILYPPPPSTPHSTPQPAQPRPRTSHRHTKLERSRTYQMREVGHTKFGRCPIPNSGGRRHIRFGRSSISLAGAASTRPREVSLPHTSPTPYSYLTAATPTARPAQGLATAPPSPASPRSPPPRTRPGRRRSAPPHTSGTTSTSPPARAPSSRRPRRRRPSPPYRSRFSHSTDTSSPPTRSRSDSFARVPKACLRSGQSIPASRTRSSRFPATKCKPLNRR